MKKCAFRMRKGKWEIFALKKLSNVCANCNQILLKYMIWEPHAKSQNSKLMRQNEYVNVFKMATCVPNSEASHVMSGLEKNM